MPDGILNLMALGLPIPNPIIPNPLGVAPIQLSKNGLIRVMSGTKLLSKIRLLII